MNSESMGRVLKDGAAREWWLVAIVVVAAMAVAAFAGGGVHTTYQAQSALIADTSLAGQYKGFPTPDDVVRDALTGPAKDAAATRAGVSGAEIGRVRLSAFGNPQNRIQVAYTSASSGRALQVVDAVDAQILAYVAGRTSVERASRQALVDLSDATLAKMEPALNAPSLTAAERADLEFKVWQVRDERAKAKAALDILGSVYTVYQRPFASRTSGTSQLAGRLAAGALAGLFVGLLVAWLRERMRAGRGGDASS